MDNVDINNNRSLIVFYCYFRVILATLLFVIAVVDNGIGISGDFDSSLLFKVLPAFKENLMYHAAGSSFLLVMTF
jgi:hypothetical protein